MFRRGIMSIAAVSLLVAGCGGSDDDDDAAPASSVSDAADDTDENPPIVSDAPSGDAGDPAETAPSDTEASDTESDATADAGGGESGGGASVATVSVGDQTFEFAWEADSLQRCDTDAFGGYWALAQSLDGQPGFEAELWPEGTGEGRPNRINLSDGADMSWSANPEGGVGTAADNWPGGVDSVEFDDNTASGTATFVAQYDYEDPPTTFPGSFTITCG